MEMAVFLVELARLADWNLHNPDVSMVYLPVTKCADDMPVTFNCRMETTYDKVCHVPVVSLKVKVLQHFQKVSFVDRFLKYGPIYKTHIFGSPTVRLSGEGYIWPLVSKKNLVYGLMSVPKSSVTVSKSDRDCQCQRVSMSKSDSVKDCQCQRVTVSKSVRFRDCQCQRADRVRDCQCQRVTDSETVPVSKSDSVEGVSGVRE
ncbi:hypothetical protein Btru_034602 [Bulinus truncatus]|nr:hypothetical protein Btru_034602 [Bulinus truncatus]